MASTVKAARLYVGRLPWTVGHRQLKEYFAQFGLVKSANVIFDQSTGISRGYGFVEFASEASATNALNKQVHSLEGQNLVIQTQSRLE